MNEIFKNQSIFSSLEKRFDPLKYTYFEIPYIMIKQDQEDAELFPKVLEENEISLYENNYEIKRVIAVFKKLNWSIDHEIRRQSRSFNFSSFKYEFDFGKYCNMVIKKLLVLVIDTKTGEEQYIDFQSAKNLHATFTEGLISYFFKNQPHHDDMDDEEQVELSLAIHDYLSFYRKKSANDTSIAYKEPPPCPAILIEKAMANETGWTLDYIRSLDYRDIIALNICETQKNVNEQEGSTKPDNMSVNVDGVIQNVKSIAEAKEKIGVKTIKKKYKTNNKEDDENKKIQPIINTTTTTSSEESINRKSNINSFISSLIENPKRASDAFFDQAQKQKNIKKK